MERRGGQPRELAALEHHITDVMPLRDERAGEGFEGWIGAVDAPVGVQVFPDAGIARIRTPLADVTVRRVCFEVDEANQTLLLSGSTDQEWTSAQISRNGAVVFARFPQQPLAEDLSPTELLHRLTRKTPDSTARQEPTPEQTADRIEPPSDRQRSTPGSGSPEEEQPRLTLAGRIGFAPKFRTTPRGTLVGSFVLAVHDQPGETSWHEVRVFGEKAQKLQEKGYGKGQEVEVIGYLHTRERPGKDGVTTTVEEIYAAAVREPKDRK